MGILVIKFFIVFTYGVMLIMNILANMVPFFGRTTGEVSAQFPTLLTPAGFAFSIWGLIYILLGVVTFRLLLMPSNLFEGDALRVFVVTFITSSLLNGLWLLAWHSLSPWLSLAVITGLLLSLVLAYLHIPDHAFHLRPAFSIYLAWISVATILNATIAFSTTDFLSRIPPVPYFIGALMLGVLLAGIMLSRRGDIPYALVFLWAYLAIFVRHLSDADMTLYASAGLAAIILTAMTTWTLHSNGFALYAE